MYLQNLHYWRAIHEILTQAASNQTMRQNRVQCNAQSLLVSTMPNMLQSILLQHLLQG